MPGVSKLTKVMMVRLPVEVAKVVERRARNFKGGEISASDYMRRILVAQIVRPGRK